MCLVLNPHPYNHCFLILICGLIISLSSFHFPLSSFIFLSKIWFAFLQPLQNCPPILGHVYATPAKSSPNSGAGLCNPCKVFPQFWGGFMQPLQSLPPILGHVSATPAKCSPNSGACLCNPCKIVPQFWGMILQPLQRCAPDLGQCFQSHSHLLSVFRTRRPGRRLFPRRW